MRDMEKFYGRLHPPDIEAEKCGVRKEGKRSPSHGVTYCRQLSLAGTVMMASALDVEFLAVALLEVGHCIGNFTVHSHDV